MTMPVGKGKGSWREPACFAACMLAATGWCAQQPAWRQPDPQVLPGLYSWSDTCNIYVLKDGDAAILIDLGDGTVLDRLNEIGVSRVEWVLFTHHHREQCQGFPRLKGSDVKTAAPAAERPFFESPTTFRKMKPTLDDAFSVYGASYVRPPVEPIPIDRALQCGDTFEWRGYRLRCLETPGHSPGGMTYLLDAGDRRLAFSGDLMVDGARMQTWFDSEWDYGYGKGLETLIASVERLAKDAPALLLPSHGPSVTDPAKQLAEYSRKLRDLLALYVRGYPVATVTDDEKDSFSTPTVVPGIHRVTPHLYKFRRPNESWNFSIVIADSGRALVHDCGLMSAQVLDRALAGMKEHLGLKQIDALIVSHAHGDHFLLGEHLRTKYGASVWTTDRVADQCEHPERFDRPAMIQTYRSGLEALAIDRRLKEGETIAWEGMRLQVDWMPGQTDAGCCLWLDLDGWRIAFTGDNLFGNPADPKQDGHEAVVARNGAIFEEGYAYAAEYLKKLQPDLLMGGHSFVMPRPAAFIERYARWSKEIVRSYRKLSPDDEYRYRFDPFWVRAHPYRASLVLGGSVEVQVVVRNFRAREQRHRIAICAPPGFEADPPVLEGMIGAASQAAFPVRLHAPADAAPGVRLVAFDLALDGERYGQWFDFILHVEEAARKP